MNDKINGVLLALALALISTGVNAEQLLAANVDQDGKPVPQELLAAYQKFVDTAKNGDVGDVVALALPSSLAWSLTARAPGKDNTGPEVNMPFLKKGFSSEISLIRSEKKNCYLIRTGTTALWYVKGADMQWWIYKYVDRPIR